MQRELQFLFLICLFSFTPQREREAVCCLIDGLFAYRCLRRISGSGILLKVSKGRQVMPPPKFGAGCTLALNRIAPIQEVSVSSGTTVVEYGGEHLLGSIRY